MDKFVVEVFSEDSGNWVVSSDHRRAGGIFEDFFDANSWANQVVEDYQNAGFWETPVRIREV